MASVALLLAAAAIIAGAAAGALEALKRHMLGPWKCFLIYLGLLGVAATTWAESMEILPLALLYGAFTGIVPFVLGYFVVRRLFTSRRKT